MSRLLERLPSLPLLEEAGLPSLSPVVDAAAALSKSLS